MTRLVIHFLAIVLLTFSQVAKAEDSFTIGDSQIVFESPQGCVNSNIIDDRLNEYFSKSNPKVVHAVSFISDKTATDWIIEKRTGEKARNLQILSIGYQRELTGTFSEKGFQDIVQSQTSGFEKIHNSNTITYLGKEHGNNYEMWTITVFNNGVYSTVSTALVSVKNKIIHISSSASFQNEQNRKSQLIWSRKACKNAISMIINLNI